MQENILNAKNILHFYISYVSLLFSSFYSPPPPPRMGCFPSSFFFRHLIDSCDTSIEMWAGAYNVDRFIADE